MHVYSIQGGKYNVNLIERIYTASFNRIYIYKYNYYNNINNNIYIYIGVRRLQVLGDCALTKSISIYVWYWCVCLFTNVLRIMWYSTEMYKYYNICFGGLISYSNYMMRAIACANTRYIPNTRRKNRRDRICFDFLQTVYLLRNRTVRIPSCVTLYWCGVYALQLQRAREKLIRRPTTAVQAKVKARAEKGAGNAVVLAQ